MRHLTLRHQAKDCRRSTEGGFTLLELTVAMGLSLLLLGMVLSLFDQLYYLSDSAAAIADTNQTVRASIKQVVGSLKIAGAGIPTGGIPFPSGTSIPSVVRPGPGSQTFPPSPGTGPPPPVLAVITPGNGICNGASTISGACDEITLILVDQNSSLNQYPLTAISSSPAQITVDSRTSIGPGPSSVIVGDLIMLSNNNGAAIAYATNANTTTNVIQFGASDPMLLNQPSATAGTIANLATPCSPSPCTPAYPPTYAYEIQMITYYLDNTGAQPNLMKQVNLRAPSIVASNVTALQFTYDLSDGATVNQASVTQRNQIRKVNVSITGRSSRPLRKTNGYFSNTISTSIMLRNLAYGNKYQ